MTHLISNRLSIIFLLIQITLIVIFFNSIPNTEYQSKIEKQIFELKFQNQETKNLLLSIKSNSSSQQVYSIENNNKHQINEIPEKTISHEEIKSLIEGEIESILSEKLTVFRDDIQKQIQITPSAFPAGIQNPVISSNKQFIDKQYDSITDDNFKSNLILADEIIDRAIYAGEFTEWDAEELNIGAQDLEFDNKVFIMNKLSHAYNSQKIKGKFIKFKLVNRSSEN